MAYYVPIGLPPPLDIKSGPSFTSMVYNPNLYNNILTASNDTIRASTEAAAITANKIGSVYDAASTAGAYVKDQAGINANTIISTGTNYASIADTIASNYTDQVESQNEAKVASDKLYYDYKTVDSTNTSAANIAGLKALTDIVKSDNTTLSTTSLAKIDANKETEIDANKTLVGLVKTLTDSAGKLADGRNQTSIATTGAILGDSSGGGGGSTFGGSGTSTSGSSTGGRGGTTSTTTSRPSGSDGGSSIGDILFEIIKFIVGIVIIVGLGFGGYYLYKYVKKEKLEHEKTTGEKISTIDLFNKKTNLQSPKVQPINTSTASDVTIPISEPTGGNLYSYFK